MPLRAITFDFWSTLVDGDMTPDRLAARTAHLQRVLAEAGHQCTVGELQSAFSRALDRVSNATRETLEDVGPAGRWAEVALELGIPAGLIPYEVVERAYDDLTLEPLPDLMPHVEVAVTSMRQAGYRLGVICNTGMVGGQVLRKVLEQHGLFDFFDITVFSNEFGLSKPHPRIFEHTLGELGGIAPTEALHVGDLEELDVEGARRAGLHAARYVPDTDGRIETDADLVVTDCREFPRQISDYTRTED